MSCAAVSAAALLWLASGPPGIVDATSPRPVPPQSAVAHEPLFADIIRRAGALKAEVERLRKAGRAPGADFAAEIRKLSDLDIQGHVTLRERGTDGDLKCILKGISEDLPLKLEAVKGAGDRKARDEALAEMSYLLSDNVEVITAPPAPPV